MEDGRPGSATGGAGSQPAPLGVPAAARAEAAPRGCTEKERVEWLKCRRSPGYFLDTYGQVYDATPGPDGEPGYWSGGWAPFHLWPAQRRICRVLQRRRLVAVLKARQLGLSWLVTGFALWLMLFRPASTVLLFSKRDDEAVHLLAFRLKGMYERLPDWMSCRTRLKDSAHELRLSNGSAALAFPTTGGRSYTASLVLVDEADFAPNLEALMNAVKPTVDAGGRLVLISTADKSRPQSAFKRIYRAGREGGATVYGSAADGSAGCGAAAYGDAACPGEWVSVFLPWSARPDRTDAWYATQTRDVLARTGSLDDLWQEYPSTDFEALAGRSMDKRFAPEWIKSCDRTGEPACGLGPAIPGLSCFLAPEAGRAYAIGADPAEGNPQSDESAASVVDVLTGEQVAVLAGRFDPSVFAGHVAELAEFYNDAEVLIERNNHGHAVLLWLAEFSSVSCLAGLDGKPGWLQTGKGKPLCVDAAADALRDGVTGIRDVGTRDQLASIMGSTLKAPEGEHDDRALAHVLALAAVKFGGAGVRSIGGVAALPVDVIEASDRGGY